MCGIAGFLAKREGVPVVESLVGMLQALYSRGPDSTGLSLYGGPHEGEMLASIWAGDDGGASAREGILEAIDRHGRIASDDYREGYFRVGLTPEDASPHGLRELAEDVEDSNPGVRVFSLGHKLEVIKYTADARTIYDRWSLGGIPFSHAIGHVRMATESRVDVNHSHPFWARPFPDISVVHNGQITNYHKLRRRLQQKGHRFATGNDSEVIAVYVADKLEAGVSLDEALRASVEDLDGTFAYLISTANGIGLARDQFAMKPLLYAEDDEKVVLASEEISIRAVFPDPALVPREMQAKEVRWWLR
jgi:glutamate synthase domain-containing protein 1